MVSPMPSASNVAMPAVPFTSPAGGGPASVTPRCRGWSKVSDANRYAAIMSGTDDALTEIFTSWKSTSSKYASSMRADSTSASGVAPPNRLYSSGCSDPAFTPMRMGTPRAFAAGDELDLGLLTEVAGVEPQSVHARLQGGERHFVVEVDVGHDRHRRAGHDVGEAFGGLLLVARAPHDVRPRRGEGVDLGERGLDVGRLRDGHGLHRDRRAATHGHAAHMDLPGETALGGGDGRTGHRSSLRPTGRGSSGGGRCPGTARTAR